MSTQIVVGAAAVAAQGYADFLDGLRAIVRRAHVRVSDAGIEPELIITPPDRDAIRWPLNQIRRVPDQALARDETILALAGDPVARLTVTDAELRRILHGRCPNLSRRPTRRGRVRLLAWAAAAVASVALIITVLVPLLANQLAEILPPAGERALGDTTFEQIRRALDTSGIAPLRICSSRPGLVALEEMKKRVSTGGDLPYPVTVSVLNHPMVNAFALPGGRIVLFRGLIDAAEDPDEIAAVLAHELGHVVGRDPARIALRSAGSVGVLGLLLGDFAGGAAVLFLTERLIDATYSREAEGAADAFAHDTLARAGIPPSAMARMFRRLRVKDGRPDMFTKHFMAHPSLGDRIARAEAADATLTGALRPSLGDADWRALRRICR